MPATATATPRPQQHADPMQAPAVVNRSGPLHLGAEDDIAIWADDTVSAVVAQRIGASPSGVAMISPARPARSQSRSAAVPPGSASKVSRAADVMSTPLSQCPKKRLFDISANVTPAFSRRAKPTCHVATSPMPSEHATTASTLQAELEQLQDDYNRVLKMYEFMRGRAEESERARAEVQGKLDEKITDVISLTSRLEEAKRFTKQLKGELRENKARALPHFNAPFTGTARVEAKYEEMLRKQEAEFQAMLERENDERQALEDALDELQVSPSHTDALLSALRARRSVEQQLAESIAAKDDLETRLQQRVAALTDEVVAVRRASVAEARRLNARLREQDDLIERMECIIQEQQKELDDRAVDHHLGWHDHGDVDDEDVDVTDDGDDVSGELVSDLQHAVDDGAVDDDTVLPDLQSTPPPPPPKSSAHEDEDGYHDATQATH